FERSGLDASSNPLLVPADFDAYTIAAWNDLNERGMLDRRIFPTPAELQALILAKATNETGGSSIVASPSDPVSSRNARGWLQIQAGTGRDLGAPNATTNPIEHLQAAVLGAVTNVNIAAAKFPNASPNFIKAYAATLYNVGQNANPQGPNAYGYRVANTADSFANVTHGETGPADTAWVMAHYPKHISPQSGAHIAGMINAARADATPGDQIIAALDAFGEAILGAFRDIAKGPLSDLLPQLELPTPRPLNLAENADAPTPAQQREARVAETYKNITRIAPAFSEAWGIAPTDWPAVTEGIGGVCQQESGCNPDVKNPPGSQYGGVNQTDLKKGVPENYNTFRAVANNPFIRMSDEHRQIFRDLADATDRILKAGGDPRKESFVGAGMLVAQAFNLPREGAPFGLPDQASGFSPAVAAVNSPHARNPDGSLDSQEIAKMIQAAQISPGAIAALEADPNAKLLPAEAKHYSGNHIRVKAGDPVTKVLDIMGADQRNYASNFAKGIRGIQTARLSPNTAPPNNQLAYAEPDAGQAVFPDFSKPRGLPSKNIPLPPPRPSDLGTGIVTPVTPFALPDSGLLSPNLREPLPKPALSTDFTSPVRPYRFGEPRLGQLNPTLDSLPKPALSTDFTSPVRPYR
ncbi:MAG: hypothetical protein AAB947_01950, partial [Patescibacteria group bacterium]